MMPLNESFEHCRRATRHHARSFYFASHALPYPKRQAAYAVYAFCRHADDLLDERDVSQPSGQVAYEQELRALLNRLYTGSETNLPFGPAFHETIRQFNIPIQPFEDLVHGVCLDQQPIQIRDWPELRNYCYHVASVVGLVMCPILGLKNRAAEAQAIELGIAMQLTNILRDIREDLERGRNYLPADELALFQVTPANLAQGQITPQFVEFMKFQIGRARDFYHRSEAGIPALATDGSQLTVWLMRTIYAGILDEIEKSQYDVFSKRAAVSTLRKLRLAWTAWHRCHRRA